jgi:hypothetical protein
MMGVLTTLRKSVLNAQPFSAFSPAAFDDQTAAPGAHAGQKSIGPGPLQIMRLIRSFHNTYTVTFSSNENSKLNCKTLFRLFVKVHDRIPVDKYLFCRS